MKTHGGAGDGTKAVVWVLCTCIPEENRPCLPSVHATEAAALAKFDELMRAEWDANKPESEETGEPLEYPGADTAHVVLSENPAWGRWELTSHEVEE